MSQPISPATVDAELLRLSDLLEDVVNEMPTLAREAAEAEVAYKKAFAQQVLTAEAKTVSDRDALATVATADLLLARRIGEAMYDVRKEKARSLAVQINALQTIASNLRGFTAGPSRSMGGQR